VGRRLITGVIACAMVLLGFPLGVQQAAAVATGSGTVSLTAIGTAYTQNFNTLASTSTSSVLPMGWFFEETGSNANATYRAGTGSDNTGDTYSFGAISSSERAFGGLQSGTLVPFIAASFTNNTGATIQSLDVTYVGEQWRLGTSGRADRLDFQVSTNATSPLLGTWTDVNALDFNGPVTTGTLGARDGNAAANRTAIAGNVPVTIPPGGTAWIRWTDFNASGADDGLAIDDFSVTPRTDAAPGVIATSPLKDATNVPVSSNISLVFSEPVNVTGAWYSIACGTSLGHTATVSGGPTTYTLDPNANFAFSESCTVTVVAANVSDQDTDDPPNQMAANFVFSFTTADPGSCGDPKTAIHSVQGSGLASPIVGTVVDIEGVVVGAYQDVGSFGGFYVEEADADWDADPATSEGIFVFSTMSTVTLGELVRVRGTVAEFSNLTEMTSVSKILICATGLSVTAQVVTLPVAALSDFERYEGMLVNFPQDLTATDTFTLGRFGEVRLAANGRLYTPTAVVAPGAPANALADANERRSFVLDDGNNQPNIDPTAQGYYPASGLSASTTLRSGYVAHGLTGVFDERFGAYRVQARGPISFDSSSNSRTTTPDPVGGTVKVASANVLNFFNGDGLGGGFPTPRGADTAFELGRQEAKIVSELAAIGADIYGLMEIENDSGPNSATAELVASLNALVGAGTYSFVDTGTIGTDEIKVALIYKPSAVTPIGGWQIITSLTDPRFIDTKNRPSLAQTFVHNVSARKFTVVVNHLKSKGSACNDVGDPDLGDGQGNCNQTRTNAAAALVDWLATDPTGSGSADFLLIGDMNSYAKEDPITRFITGGYTDLVASYEGSIAYSYVFDGQSGYIDHALASTSLLGRVSGVGHWHNNADEPIVLDYNVEFKTASQITSFYSSGPYRASDHDPVVIGLDLHDTTPPTIVAPADRAQATGPSASICGVFIADADLGSASAFDNAPGTVKVTRSGVPEFNIFPRGTTTITYTATDAAGNTATDTQVVTVFDDTPPTITAPASLTRAATGVTTFVSDADLGLVTATDNCGVASVTRSGVPAGNLFPQGTTILTYTATDLSGNTAAATQTVTLTPTATSVCATVRSFVSNAGIANSLCVKLDAAAAARARGNVSAHDNQLQAFINDVNAQRGKALTDANANTLIALTGGL